ncbi:PAS domain S-box protein [Halomarina litorea]|uniref:PAS domain S-box protein n=1 Tax=Halomarina litorea TaxID=2961595 RepID=UPI0020C38113|nr:PAS domain S-box protein [Halomarina sp. BCD28]
MATDTQHEPLENEDGPGAATIRVLHVDDDPDLLDVTQTWLEREDDRIRVRSTVDASEALDVLATDRVDCVVSDYAMPRMDGLAFLQAVRERDEHLPFVLFTGKGTEEVAAEAISLGATDYLRKGSSDTYTVLANRVVNYVEKHRAELEVERRLKALETAREGISILDEDGRFVYLNQSYADLYGYAVEELLGRHWEVLYPESDVSLVYDEILPAIPVEGRWSGETRQLRKDGSPLLTSHALSYTDSGEMVCVVRDLTEERETERLLGEERRRFDLLVDAVVEYAIFELDATGRVTSWNEGAERTTGYPEATGLGVDWAAFYTDEDRARGRPAEHLDRALAEGSVHGEGWRVREDGSRFWAETTLTTVDEAANGGGFLCVMRDSTDRLYRERQLQRRIEHLDQFASVLSHDLQTPLATARASLDLAREDPTDAGDSLDRLDRSLARIRHLTESLLTLAREGATVSSSEPVPLDAVAKRAWDLVDAPDARLVVEDGLGSMTGDPERVQTLFENLFTNSAEHGGTDVTVRVGPLDGGFYVEDDGPGIPPEDRLRVFEHGLSTVEGRTGFGLSIVERISDAHHWRVVATKGIDGGARFEFTPTDLSIVD